MSDAKAKAEARRARILGKEGSRLALAKGDISSLTPSTDTNTGEDETNEPKIETTPNRPLAARRNLVKADTNATPRSTELSEEDKAKDPESDTIDSFRAKVAESTLTPKIVREIENEIAANTIKFDKDQLADTSGKQPQLSNESDSLVNSSNSNNSSRTSKKSTENKSSTSEGNIVKIFKKKPLVSSPVQAFQVMQIIRILGIISLASFTAYRSVTQSGAGNNLPLSPLTASGSTNAALDEFLNAPSNTNSEPLPIFDYTIPADFESFSFSQALASPIQWMKNRVVRQTESTLSAVGLIWWITSMMSTMISRLFPHKPKSSSGGLMGMVMTFYNEGMQVVYEYGFKTMGEICLHFFALIATVLILTYYYESLSSSSSSSSSETTNIKVEL